MYDHEFEKKCRSMALRDTVLRVLTYGSMAVLVIMLALLTVIRYPGQMVWLELGAALLCVLCCVLLWQNLRCPHCGELLSTYYGAAYHRPKFCTACGTVILWKKRADYDLQPSVRETVECPESTDALHAKCLEIARRDRVLRPQIWISIAALAVTIILRNGGPLPEPVLNALMIVSCVYAVVVDLLWTRNLRCPACGSGLTGKRTRNRISAFVLPDEHICGHCSAHLTFIEK